MPAQHYVPYVHEPLRDRTWPDRVIEQAPIWCSVDLRDGNQALIEPMGPDRKRDMFDQLVAIGFREIEVGFPSAAEIEMQFVRGLIEEGAVPDDVTLQVLTQAREELIGPTLESIRGARRAIVHLYNSTSELQRRVVFGRDRAGIVDIAVQGARMIRTLADAMPETDVVLEYSPESFTGTELDFALEISEAVMDVWGPTSESQIIINLPATVEMSTPNVYADRIESFERRIRDREAVVLSVHPHNDRGTAVAAAELALMAGADRVEGTLFGNGERTGNVDVVTLALNMFTQGVDPGLDLSDINGLVRMVERCNRLPVHPRHPYAGELVFTAFSGSHQDAIKKGLDALRDGVGERWEVPYLPMDPAHVGRGYDELIRVNSQSGKGGVAYLLERDHGVQMPRRMQIEFQKRIQQHAEETGEEVGAERIWETFRAEYLEPAEPYALVERQTRVTTPSDRECGVSAVVVREGERHEVGGRGNGPIDAFFAAVCEGFGLDLSLSDYREHALGGGADAAAMAYVEVRDGAGRAFHGAGRHANIVWASLLAVVSAVNRSAAVSGSGETTESED
jgi:2-isopropylmalate synthase